MRYYERFVVCERCDREMYGDETVYITECQNLCENCVKEAAVDALVDVSFDELLDEDVWDELEESTGCRCEWCKEKDAAYSVKGEPICEDCIKKYAVEEVEYNGDPMDYLDYRTTWADSLAEDEYIAANEDEWIEKFYGEC